MHYEKADLEQVVDSHPDLTSKGKAQLLQVLASVPKIFYGTLGKISMPPVHLELTLGVEPYISRPFLIPQVHYETVKNDVKYYYNSLILTSLSSSIQMHQRI